MLISTSERFRLKSDETTQSDRLAVMKARNFPLGDIRNEVNGPLARCCISPQCTVISIDIGSYEMSNSSHLINAIKLVYGQDGISNRNQDFDVS